MGVIFANVGQRETLKGYLPVSMIKKIPVGGLSII
jgi:hypothetical protein